jgi:putative hydrolase of the HAD superfamily
VVLSEEVGSQKPNPRIYQAALDRCGLKSEDVLMIGDSWYSDILGAINAGIDQMWIKRGEHTPDDQQKVTFLVRDLAEAADLLLKED